MFFNFFIFTIVISGFYKILELVFGKWGITAGSLAFVDTSSLPIWTQLLIFFVLLDFVQWFTHICLHRFPILWRFHKIHHSVKEMGFAAHLRYHWMENIVYRSIEYLPLALLGIGLYDFFIIHIFTLAVGHYNHANITVSGQVTGGILGALIGTVMATSSFDITLLQGSPLALQIGFVLLSTLLFAVLLGPVMKRIFNSPEMHIWHHAHDLPDDHRYGINFGITLSLWDYLFGTAYVPYEGRDIKLGFPEVEQFPQDFLGQNLHGFGGK